MKKLPVPPHSSLHEYVRYHPPCYATSISNSTQVAAMPSVSAVVDEFARKARCQESILFLKDVTRFQSDGYDDFNNDWGGGDGMEYSSNFDAFSQIVIRYIVDGAPEEVNI
ncbi:unnamed protein product, partial [Ectocarpus sp. 12 AP-2014]